MSVLRDWRLWAAVVAVPVGVVCALYLFGALGAAKGKDE